MAKIFIIVTLFVSITFSGNSISFAEEVNAQGIINKTRSTYQSLQKYASSVQMIFDEKNGVITNAKIELGRPHLYRIDYREKGLSGSIWNDGSGPKGQLMLPSGETLGDGVHQFSNDKEAFDAFPVAYDLVSLFYSLSVENILSELKNPEITGNESINGEDCYVIEENVAEGSKTKIWVSKKKLLLIKIEELKLTTMDMSDPKSPQVIDNNHSFVQIFDDIKTEADSTQYKER